MSKRTLLIAFVLLSIPLASFGIVFSNRSLSAPRAANKIALSPQTDPQRNSYEEDLGRIKAVKHAKDVAALAELADEIESKWAKSDKQYYGDLMIELVGALSGFDFKDDRQHLLAIKYAKVALSKADELPLDAEIRLARFLEGGPGHATGQMAAESWAGDRFERATLWLHASRRLEQTINRDFDFNDRPTLNVLPPRGSGPLGITPDSIKDPQARAVYERAIATNKQKTTEYGRQLQLRQLDHYFTPHVKRFLIEAYSKPPYNLQELRTSLSTYNVDQAVTTEILTKVSRAISESSIVPGP